MQSRLLPILALAVLSPGLCTLQAADPASTLPTVTVSANQPAPAVVSENDPVGPSGRPEWTSHRRFGTTRVYIQQDPWEVGFESWWRNRSYGDSGPQNRFMEEVEIGLPGRLQLDLYYNFVNEDHSTHFDEMAAELRWALANWGVIPGNPTLYIEYAFVNHDFGGDTLESKVLFGDDFAKNWHWGLNFVFETELSHERAKEVVIAGGLSRTLIDGVLSAGLEMQWKRETVAGDRDNPEVQFEIGPSLQWRPTQSTHVDLVQLFGTTDEGPDFESFVIFGWDFGGHHGPAHGYTPTAVHQ